MFLFVILFFVILLFLIPIPLKVTLHYSKDNYYLKFYNINIYSKESGILRKFISSSKSKDFDKKPQKKDIDTNKRFEKDKKVKKQLSFKKLYLNIKKNKIKPKLAIDLDFNYSLNDAGLNAISYGILCNLYGILYTTFSTIFKVNKFKLDINPLISKPLLLNFTIKSIIRFNLVQIIYILFLFINSKTNVKEATPV